MKQKDDQLRALLRQWQDIEPAGNFESNVHRRIRLATTPERREAWWLRLLWRPSFAMGAALVIAVSIGAWAGKQTVTPREEATFLAADTLTGRYLALNEGEQQ